MARFSPSPPPTQATRLAPRTLRATLLLQWRTLSSTATAMWCRTCLPQMQRLARQRSARPPMVMQRPVAMQRLLMQRLLTDQLQMHPPAMILSADNLRQGPPVTSSSRATTSRPECSMGARRHLTPLASPSRTGLAARRLRAIIRSQGPAATSAPRANLATMLIRPSSRSRAATSPASASSTVHLRSRSQLCTRSRQPA
jgi:hypothetical protein